MPRFLLKPRWIAFTVLIVVLVVVMVNLAFWQLRRLDERKAQNAAVRARQAAPVQPLAAVVPPGTPVDGAAAARWYTVRATGTYDDAHQVRIRNRSQDGVAGEHVVTPLVQADGTAVLVNRGFIPANRGETAIPPSPAGTVTVEGRVRTSQVRGSIGPADPADGHTRHAEPGRHRAVGGTAAVPGRAGLPRADGAGAPGRSPGPRAEPPARRGPAPVVRGQWLLFSVLAVVGWALVVRKTMKDEKKQAARLAKTHAQMGEPLPDSVR